MEANQAHEISNTQVNDRNYQSHVILEIAETVKVGNVRELHGGIEFEKMKRHSIREG